MYDLVQYAIKGLLTAVMVYGCVRLWRMDIDVRAIANSVGGWVVSSPIDALPARDPEAIYRDGSVVARVYGRVTVDQGARTVEFQELYGLQGDMFQFAMRPEPIEYQRWRILVRHTKNMVGMQPGSPRPCPRLFGVRAQILGDRVP